MADMTKALEAAKRLSAYREYSFDRSLLMAEALIELAAQREPAEVVFVPCGCRIPGCGTGKCPRCEHGVANDKDRPLPSFCPNCGVPLKWKE